MADRTVTVRLRGIVTDYQNSMRQASQATKGFASGVAQSARQNKQHFDAIGVAALGVGAAAALGLKQAADAAISFESSFAGVRKTVDASEAEFAEMAAGFRQMATEIPVTVEELSGIGEAAGQLGIAKDSILDFSRTMADLGVATNMTSEEAATSLARLANITQMPQDEFDRLGSTVVALGNNLATTEGEIVEMGLRLAGAGAQVGMAEAEILGLAGALSSVGIRAEAGGSAISKVMIEIASEVENGGDKLATFAEVAGMSAQEFSTAYRDDATEAIIRFIEGLGSMEEQGGSTLGVLEELGITEVRMRDALLRTSGAGDQLREAIELGNGAWEENNALTKEAEQRYATTASKIQMAKNSVNDLMISIGDALLPIVAGAADSVAGLAGVLESLHPSVLQVGTGLTAMAAAAGIGGGAILLMLPRVVAIRDAMRALNITKATTLSRMGAIAKFMVGPWGIALTAASAGLSVFNRHQQDARAFAEALHDQLVETPGDLAKVSDETLTATLRAKDVMGAWRDTGLSLDVLRRAMQGSAKDIALVESQFDTLTGPIDALQTAIPGLRDEKRDLAHTISDLMKGTKDYLAQVENMPEAMGRATYAATEFTPAAGAAAEITDEMREAAAEAGVDIDEMTESTEQSTSVFEGFAPAIVAAFLAIGQGFDPMRRYTELQQEAAAATETATGEMADSWSNYMASLEQTLTDQRNWHDNLNKIREASNDEYADMLAAQGPEHAGLHAEIAAQSEAEIQSAADRALTIRDEANAEAIDRLLRSAPEWVDAAGTVGAETVAEIADKLGMTEEAVRTAIDNSIPALEASMGTLAEVAGMGAASVVGAMIGELGLAASDIARITADWSVMMERGLTPIVASVGGKPIVVSAGPPTTGHSRELMRRNTGGLIPGRGPDEDTVPAMLTRGEFVVARAAVDRYGVDALEALNSGRLDPQTLHLNAGGFVSPDDIPAVPQFTTGSPPMNLAGTRVLDGVRAMAAKFVEENAAPALGPGIGYQAMMAALRVRFPGLPLLSGFRPGAITATGNPSYHGMGRAVDIPPRMDVNKWIAENYGAQTKELILSLPGATQLRNGRPHTYTGITRAMHFDHNHWAMNQGGLVGRDGVKSFDEGGLLPPGVSLSGNFTGAHELVVAKGMIRDEIENALSGQTGIGNLRIALAVEGIGSDLGAGSASDAIRLIEDLTGAWEDAHRQASDAAERSRLAAEVERARAEFEKADAEDRVRLHDAWAESIRRLEDADQRRREGEAQRRIQAELARLETQRQIEANRAAYEFDQMATSDQLALIERKLAAERQYTDEWMDLARQRDRLSEEITRREEQRLEELTRARDDALDNLNRLLDERRRILDQIEDVEVRHGEQTAAARRQFDEAMVSAQERRDSARAQAAESLADRLTQIEERAADERERIVSSRGDALLGFFSPESRLVGTFTNSLQAVTDNVLNQLDAFDQWASGLDDLRSMGLSEDVISAMDLETPSARSLATVRGWKDATAEEIQAANEAFASMNEAATEQAADEAGRMLGAVGQALADLSRRTADETAQIRRDHAAQLASINEDFHASTSEAREQLNDRLAELDEDMREQLSELTEELGQIGVDQGRSYSEAIAEGIRSGIPAIEAAVRDAVQAMTDLHAASPVTPSANMSTSDLQAYARSIDWTEDLSLLKQRIKTQGFDEGGWLPPHSATLAINNTPRWEPVGAGTHMGGGVTVQVDARGAVPGVGAEVERAVHKALDAASGELRQKLGVR